MALDAYTEYLTGLGLAPNTVRNYTAMVRRARAWAAEDGVDLCDLTPKQAVELAGMVPNSHGSRRQLRSALCHYWQMHGVVGPAKAFRVPKKPRPRWRGLEEEQVKALLGAARGDWPRGGVILLGLYLGLRREEIATLRWSDFTPDLAWVRIMGKGDRTRHLPVHPRLGEVLKACRWPGEWVFPGRLGGGHVSLATINKWVAELGSQAGIGHIHPHRLRHTSGNMVYQQTGDIYTAQAWLGHAEVETTQVYTRVEDDRLVRAMCGLTWEGPTEPREPPAATELGYVDPDDLSERLWLEDQTVAKVDAATVQACYEKYAAEGHLVTCYHVDRVPDPSSRWVCRCTCAATSGRDLLSYAAMKAWCRDHRHAHGLDRQDWYSSQRLTSVN